VYQKNFGLFFTTLSGLQAAQLLIKTGKSDKDAIKLILSKFMKPLPPETNAKSTALVCVYNFVLLSAFNPPAAYKPLNPEFLNL